MTMDSLWLLICILALLFMQLGFCLLEAGYVRSKNTINVVIKNSIDFTITLLVFALIGYSLMFGSSLHGMIGVPEGVFYNNLLIEPEQSLQALKIMIYSLFCATAVTIISGAAAERITFKAYLFMVLLVATFLFPVAGHWIWASAGWLKQQGFIDFSGATVVHSLGGWVALATVIYIGPRTDRFKTSTHNNTQSIELRPGNTPYIAMGTLVLWISWLGFNGAGFLAFSHKIPLILLVTLLAGSSAMVIGMVISYFSTGKANVLLMMNCGLGGLVTSTAVCHLINPLQAILLGSVAGGVIFLGNHLLEMIKLDDVVGAIPVHLFCGILSTLSVPFFVSSDTAGFFEQFTVQLTGVLSVGLLAFPCTLLLIKVLDKFSSVRVSKEAEMIGLNMTEHGARTPMLDVLVQMSEHSTHDRYDEPIAVSSYDEAGHIATFYNALMSKTNNLHSSHHKLSRTLNSLKDKDPLTQSLARRAWLDRLILAHHELFHNVLVTVALVHIKNLDAINKEYGESVSDAVLKHTHSEIQRCVTQNSAVGRLKGNEFAILLLDASELQGEALAETLSLSLNDTPFIFSDKKIMIEATLLVRSPHSDEDAEAFLHTLQHEIKS